MLRAFTGPLLLAASLLLVSCSSSLSSPEAAGITVVALSPTYPVLIGKTDNPVYRINITPTGSEAPIIQAFTLTLEGDDLVKNVQAVSIYYTGATEGFSPQKAFARSEEISTNIQLSGQQVLTTGDNYFWLSLQLKNDGDPDGRIKPSITTLSTNSEKVKLPLLENKQPKRFGHALRQHGDDGVDTYRIPGLVTTNAGTLLAVYDVRRNQSVDLQEDIDVGLQRSTDGGKSWEQMRTIIDLGKWGGLPEMANGVGDPSILVDRETGTIWVAALWLHGHVGKRAWFASEPGMTPRETGQFVLVKSEDDGVSWSEVINITEQIKLPEWQLLLAGPGKGITMTDGTLVFPAQYKDAEQVPHATIIYSKNHGESWSIGTGAKSHTTESQVVELADNTLMLNMRDDRGSGPKGKNGTGARSVLVTPDLGKSWTEHPTSRKALPEPVCMASLIRQDWQGKQYLLFANPDDQYVRQNLTIKASPDEGMSWPQYHHLLIDEGRGRGYSCLTTVDENTMGLIYEGSQADLVFQRIPLRDILNQQQP